MDKELSLDGLRNAIRNKRATEEDHRQRSFESLAADFEVAIKELITSLHETVAQVPELNAVIEEETETFTHPAYPGRSTSIASQRLRVTLDDDYLLFDPTAEAHFTTHGRVEIRSSRPLTFLMEKTLYLGSRGERRLWGYRSVDNLGGGLTALDGNGLLRMLGAVFA